MKNNYYNIALIMGASILAGAINYAYYPLMLRYMSLEDFGLFGSIMGVLNLIGVISGGIILFLNKEISKNISEIGKVKNIYISSLKILFLTGIVGSIIFAMLSPILANYFKVQEIGYFLLVGTTIILSFCSTAVQSVLRGMKKFSYLSFTQILSPVLKLTIGLSLVILGYNIYGAIYGVLLSGALSLIISLLYIQILFRGIQKQGNTRELFADMIKNKKDFLQFFFISLFFALFMNIDVIFVQNIFDSTSAGAYVGIAVLGKFLIFLLLSIETVYYGQIMEHPKETLPRHLIINPLVIMTLTILGAIVFNIFFGNFILSILKPELAEYEGIYIFSLVYYGILAYISFFSKICIGWGKYSANSLLIFSFILLTLSVYTIGKESLESFVLCFIGVGILTSFLLGVLFFTTIKTSH